MTALAGKLTKKLVENLSAGRHGDGNGLYLVVDLPGARRWIVREVPAYGPHSFRHMLTHVGMDLCPTPRAFKAWSQNFGHSDVATTLHNYGKLTSREQVQQIRMLSDGHQ